MSGNTITLDGVGGTVVVSASQNGNDEYNPAMSIEQSFEVLLQDQTIDFEMIGDKLTNDSDFEITATATSGLEVVFNVLSGPASVAGNMVSLDGTPGTVTVEAVQDGDNDFNPAVSVEQSFEVLLFNSTNTLEDETVFIVYPNPVEDRLQVLDDSKRSGSYEMIIHDVYGRMMQRELLNFGTNQVQVIDVKEFASGLYMITLFKEGSSVTMRFVKQ